MLPACCAGRKDGLRLLGGGEIKAKLSLTVDHATASAKAAIEKAGGSIKLIEKKVLPADEAKRKKSEAKKGQFGQEGNERARTRSKPSVARKSAQCDRHCRLRDGPPS